MSSSEVVKYFRRKTATGFDEPISYLGAEQRFVGALRNSNNNNLEEQFLIGSDCYTETYVDPNSGDTVIKKSYYKSGTSYPTNYYYVLSRIYAEGQTNTDYYFENDEIRFPYDIDAVVYGDGSPSYPDEKTLYMLENDIFVFDDSESNLIIYPKSLTVIRKDELHFIQSDRNDILVSTKITGKKYASDGITEIIVESITNEL